MPTSTAPNDRLLRLPEVGEHLDLSVHMVRRLIRRRELAAVNISTGAGRPTWRVAESALRDYVDERTAAPMTHAAYARQPA